MRTKNRKPYAAPLTERVALYNDRLMVQQSTANQADVKHTILLDEPGLWDDENEAIRPRNLWED